MPPPTFSIELHLEDPFQAEELSIENEPDEINRLLMQTAESSSHAVFKTEVQKISYGHLPDNIPAALIVFQSRFHFTSRNRIKHATIRLAFADELAPTDPHKAPRIVKIASLWQQGMPAEQTSSSTNSLGASIDVSNTGMILHHDRSSTNERQQTRHAVVKGVITSHHPRKHPSILNRAIWSMDENEVQRVGIPLVFRGAVLVRYEGPFQMAVEVDVVQGFVNSMLEFLRKSRKSKDDPVRFTPGQSYLPDTEDEGDFGKVDIEELVAGPRTIFGVH